MAQTRNDMNVFDLIYPIGSIYLSVSDVNPATLFGGSWTRITDRFLLGAGGSYSNGATGGESSHTLTVDEMPSNIGKFNALSWASNNGTTGGKFSVTQMHCDRTAGGGGDFGDANYTLSGGNQSHNNMPPYLAVYIWKRTA